MCGVGVWIAHEKVSGAPFCHTLGKGLCCRLVLFIAPEAVRGTAITANTALGSPQYSFATVPPIARLLRDYVGLVLRPINATLSVTARSHTVKPAA